MLKECLISIGSNQERGKERPLDVVISSLKHLKYRFGQSFISSPLYRSPAFPPGSGPDFVNAAARFYTAETAEVILSQLHEIENEFGRLRYGRWSARILDLDLLALGPLCLPDETTHRLWRDMPLHRQRTATPKELILPHPRLQDRAFVLKPLVKIAPNWRHPLLMGTVQEMAAALPPEDMASVEEITVEEITGHPCE